MNNFWQLTGAGFISWCLIFNLLWPWFNFSHLAVVIWLNPDIRLFLAIDALFCFTIESSQIYIYICCNKRCVSLRIWPKSTSNFDKCLKLLWQYKLIIIKRNKSGVSFPYVRGFSTLLELHQWAVVYCVVEAGPICFQQHKLVLCVFADQSARATWCGERESLGTGLSKLTGRTPLVGLSQ